MELRQLEYFVAVAEEAGFTRAAERVHISQSGVSAQVRALERELGATLFDRSTRAATLTAAGEAALRHARAALQAAEAVRRAVDEVNSVVRGRLVVGMVTACTVTPLFEALAAFHRAHPAVQVTLIEDVSDRLVEGLRAAAVDLALVGTAAAPPEGLASHVLVRERLVARVAPDHPLARRRAVRLRDVCAHPVVCLPPGTGIRAVFDEACAAGGLRAAVALQASAPDAVADLAQRGLAVGVLSETTAPDDGEGGRTLVIGDVSTPALLSLVWRTPVTPALGALVAHCRDAFGIASDAAG
jgi:DNA-binding transcriptional LysR family regulator